MFVRERKDPGGAMFTSAVILILSTALFFFYLQAICQRVLQRQFSQSYFKAIVSAYRLEFPGVLEGEAAAEVQAGRLSARDLLATDYLTLDYLLSNKLRHRYSLGERLLSIYFRFSISTLSLRRVLGLSEKASTHRLAVILQYFANVVGEQMPALAASE
jgi:hypothetical protein